MREELVNFLLEAVAEMRHRVREAPIRERVCCHLREGPDDLGFDTTSILEPDFALYVWKQGEVLMRDPRVLSLANHFEQKTGLATAFRLSGGSAELLKEFSQCYLWPLPAHILEEAHNGKDIEQAVNLSLGALDAYIQSNEIEVRVSAPLVGLKSSLSSAEVAEGVTIRRVTSTEVASYIEGELNYLPTSDIHLLRSIEHVLEKVVRKPRMAAKSFPSAGEVEQLFSQILKALRLVSTGRVGFPWIEAQAYGFLGPSGGGRMVPAPWEKYVFGGNYELTLEKARLVRNLHSRISELEKNPRFSIALNRLMRAYYKPNKLMADERMIDYWVGLESLVLPDGAQGELRFKAALRLAYLMGEGESRRKLFKQTLKSYDARSSVVHGSTARVDEQILIQTEEILRCVLRKFVEFGKVPSGEWLNSLVLGANT